MKRDIVFLVCTGILVLIFIVGVFIGGKDEISIIENRELEDFPTFSVNSFLENSYQTDLETALADQIAFGEDIKTFYNNIKNHNFDMVVSSLKIIENNKPRLANDLSEIAEENQLAHADEGKASQSKSNNVEDYLEIEQRKLEQEKIEQERLEQERLEQERLEQERLEQERLEQERLEQERLEQERLELIQEQIAEGRIPDNYTFDIDITPKGSGYFQLDNSGHLVVPKRTMVKATTLFEPKANNYNQLVKNYPELTFYSYYIETDVDLDFVDGNIDHELVNGFFEMLDPEIKKGALYINKPEDYQKYFYKTDHHWDVEGQQRGYQGIISLLKGDEEKALDIETELIEGVIYNGYKSRAISDFNTKDEFSILVSDLPEHKVLINGVEGQYGVKNEYLSGKYYEEKGINHYGICNGGDFGLVEYRFNQPEEENILVFVESFSNPIKGFVASHFNNTYYVDLRHYERTYEKEFDFGDFVQAHDIDHVLFTGYYFYYANNQFLIPD